MNTLGKDNKLMKNHFKDNLQLILLLTLVGFVIYNFFFTQDIQTDVKGYQDKIETLSNQIDTITIANNKLNIKLSEVNNNITEISENIDIVDDNIKNFKQKTNEKINSVDDYTFNELEQFFTNRYK